MRKFIIGALIAFAGLAGLAAPASAAAAGPQSVQGCPGTKSQNNDGITVFVYFKEVTGSCVVSQVMASNMSGGSMYGHFYVWGPDGYATNSPTKTWGYTEGFITNPNYVARSGQLWCGKFYDGNNNPVTRNVCVTI
ncbi:hypothetical protein SAMN05421504_12112 [Amycolatopsis xylanica]|uniref:Uncharacterized protein n=1 Tax=Amycolatopsis xylanica TaxID=589385 RepID=A0A1H3TA91_9PSEU|nr:hypothetical protein [Amycolatopsis xylanica]SDZ47020.1 hypothetical protein SAMN05421504_12112 [Amycolatopsis xylanica]